MQPKRQNWWREAVAPHSSTLAWKIPWTEEPGRLQSMGSRRVGHDWVTSLSLFTFMLWRRKWQPTPVFLPGESRDGGASWAAVYEVSQSQTGLKRLSRRKWHYTLYMNIAESRYFITLLPQCPGYMLTLHNLQTIRKEYNSFSRKKQQQRWWN